MAYIAHADSEDRASVADEAVHVLAESGALQACCNIISTVPSELCVCLTLLPRIPTPPPTPSSPFYSWLSAVVALALLAHIGLGAVARG